MREIIVVLLLFAALMICMWPKSKPSLRIDAIGQDVRITIGDNVTPGPNVGHVLPAGSSFSTTSDRVNVAVNTGGQVVIRIVR